MNFDAESQAINSIREFLDRFPKVSRSLAYLQQISPVMQRAALQNLPPGTRHLLETYDLTEKYADQRGKPELRFSLKGHLATEMAAECHEGSLLEPTSEETAEIWGRVLIKLRSKGLSEEEIEESVQKMFRLLEES